MQPISNARAFELISGWYQAQFSEEPSFAEECARSHFRGPPPGSKDGTQLDAFELDSGEILRLVAGDGWFLCPPEDNPENGFAAAVDRFLKEAARLSQMPDDGTM